MNESDEPPHETALRMFGPAKPKRPTMVISGGSRGLGRHLVECFAGEFNVVFGFLNSRSDARTLSENVAKTGGWALPFACDVTDPVAVARMADWVGASLAPCETLIHTAGLFSMKPLNELDAGTWRAELDSTVSAGFHFWRTFENQLKQHERARVVFIGDSAAEQLRARKQSVSYFIGKHGLVILARTIASENQSTGLTCNVVSPGVLPNSIDLDQPGMKANVQFEEVAGVVKFLLSPAADAVSGSHVVASRGWNV